MPPKKSDDVLCCPVCIKIVTDDDEAIQCDANCLRWFHIKCIGMSKNEYSKFSGNVNLKWFCSRLDCSAPSKPSTSDVWEKLNCLIEKLDNFNNRVESLLSLPEKINDIDSKIDAVNGKLEGLDSRITCNENRVGTLESRIAALEASGPSQLKSSPDTIIAELNDRAKRSFNVMVYNLPESASPSKESRIQQNSAYMKMILDLFQIVSAPDKLK